MDRIKELEEENEVLRRNNKILAEQRFLLMETIADFRRLIIEAMRDSDKQSKELDQK